MNRVFVDTWAWLGIANKRDPYHHLAAEQHRELQANKVRYATTDYVLAEVVTALFAAISFDKAREMIAGLLRSAESGRLTLVHVSPSQFERAWQLRQKYHDKPRISFTDFTSFVVMQDLGITDVFTGDAHFRQVGLGFTLLP